MASTPAIVANPASKTRTRSAKCAPASGDRPTLQELVLLQGEEVPNDSRVLAVPRGTGWLIQSTEGVLRVALRSSAHERALRLEGIRRGHLSLLLVVAPRSARVRLNGGPLPRPAVLRTGDELAWGEAWCRLALHLRPFAGPLPQEMEGSSCALCRLEPLPGAPVWVCPSCEAVLHFEGEEKPAAQRLDCALAAPTCPSCGGPVTFKPSFVGNGGC